jgi:hypothetical protein
MSQSHAAPVSLQRVATGEAAGGSLVVRVLRTATSAASQVALMAALFAFYKLGRHAADGHAARASANALRVLRFERLLHLPQELGLQRALLAVGGLVHFANVYYVTVHFSLTTVFLVWLWVRHRAGWPRVRAVMILTTAVGLAGHTFFPLSPPRLTPASGMIDTLLRWGPSSYTTKPGSGVANQFAAMPSLHVGWAIIVAWGVVVYSRRRLRWIAIAHPIITTLVVVGTANHYWVDCLAGAAIVVGAIELTRVRPAWRLGAAASEQSADRVDGVGVDRVLVGPVAAHAREAQGDPTRVAARDLDPVEGDLDDELGTDPDRSARAPLLACK